RRAAGVYARDDSLRRNDGGRALRDGRCVGTRRAHREPKRNRAARHPQTLWARQSRGAPEIAGMASHRKFPALHNAMWPGLVGKGAPGAEPTIDLDTMLNLTAAAQVNGTRFDGVDLFLFDPHVSIDSSDDDLKRLAEKIGSRGLV